ncbi:hypothetical protein LIER_20135 [Lithospermum erythrorhizon]|uniref:Uncharacterized protein n=1 Tax=Lithospermum erythrorhizon TaxID=34254 RepID=A0AAV3QKC7_LITER
MLELKESRKLEKGELDLRVENGAKLNLDRFSILINPSEFFIYHNGIIYGNGSLQNGLFALDTTIDTYNINPKRNNPKDLNPTYFPYQKMLNPALKTAGTGLRLDDESKQESSFL